MLTSTGGLDTPDYGENKAKAGFDYDSLGSVELIQSTNMGGGVLGTGMVGIHAA